MNNDLLIEKIIALSDGELSSDESAEVYDYLAQNPELQDEMNYHLKMKNTLSRAIEQPPSHLKNKILATSSLGLVFWKTKAFISSAISSAVAVGITVAYFLVSGDLTQQEFASFEPIQNSIELPAVENYFSNIPIDSDNKIESGNKVNTANFSNKYDADYDADKPQLTNQLGISDNDNFDYVSADDIISNMNQRVFLIENSELSNLTNKLDNNDNKRNIRFGSHSPIRLEDYEKAEELKSNLYFQVRKTFAQNNIELGFNNSDKLDLNNSSYAIFYQISDNFHLGIEYSREDFTQKYAISEGNLTTTYMQYFNANIFGLSGKYNLPYKLINDKISFYTNGMIGATNLGPVTRLELGTQLRLVKTWSIYGGYEFVNLMYFFEGNTFNSSRKGLLTGLRYDF
jgi:hypothetical protein